MQKHLLPLTVFALLAVSVGIWLEAPQQPSQPTQGILFSQLAENANKVSHIQIKTASETLLDAHKQGENWLGKFKGEEYPLDKNKLTSFVAALMSARLSEAKTALPKNYVHLGVEDLTAQDSQARFVTLSSQQHEWSVLVGKRASVGNGQYVRVPNKAQSWMINAAIPLPVNSQDWLWQQILPEGISVSTLSRTDAKAWQIETEPGVSETQENVNYQLVNLPAGRALKYDTVLAGVIDNLTGLRFDRLQPLADTSTAEMTQVAVLDIQSAEYGTFVLHLWQDQQSQYGLTVSSDTPGYWQHWFYGLSEFSASQINKSVEDFLLPQNTPNGGAVKVIDEGEAPR